MQLFGLSQRHNKTTIQSIVASLTRKDTKTNAIIVKGYGVLHCQAYFASESDAIDLINKHHGTSFSSFSEACDWGVDDSSLVLCGVETMHFRTWRKRYII